ncbi:MAG: 4-hydroxy-tetrahydrodipicolinate reductase [Nanoarchaeota archaeon]|nr:4-hydroxy-tetrahydrodipicolinate reductase [Nanoarchaeota archaeon]
MKIAIIGYGGMGRMIESIAKDKGIQVASIVDPMCKQDGVFCEINKESMKGVDVAIDFTLPANIMDNIKRYCELKVNAVIGTTGWYDHVDEVKEMVKEAGIGFLWSSNFSVGVNIYFKIIEEAAKLINKVDDYDVWAYELHHHNKADSPSGTAKTLSQILISNIDRKTAIVDEKLDRKIKDNEIHFASVRGGAVNFEHTIGFDSEADCITIKHAARSRQGYALGAVLAAKWLFKKKGYFVMDDFLQSLLEAKK